MLGRKRMFMLGAAGFALSSALCGLAPTAEALIGFRALQGATAALLVPQVSAMIQVEFPPEERGSAFGVLGAVVGLGTITGPLLGGLLLGANLWGLGWRPIFLLNLPVGGLALLAAARLVRESRAVGAQRLDVGGVALVALALVLIIYPIVEGRAWGWPAWVPALLLAGLAVLAVFVVDQRRKAAGGAAPLIMPALFADQAFRVGLPTSLVFFSGVYSLFLALSVCLQVGFGHSPLVAALMIVPFQSASLIASLLSARVARRLGTRVLLLGGVLLGLGVAGIIATLLLQEAALSGWSLLPVLLVGGAGFGLVIGPLTTLILAGVSPERAAAASGVLATAQQVGGALGIAVVGALLFGRIERVAPGALSRPELFSQATAAALGFNLGAFVLALRLFALLPGGRPVPRQAPASEHAPEPAPELPA
jgi:MFS family permease